MAAGTLAGECVVEEGADLCGFVRKHAGLGRRVRALLDRVGTARARGRGARPLRGGGEW